MNKIAAKMRSAAHSTPGEVRHLLTDGSNEIYELEKSLATLTTQLEAMQQERDRYREALDELSEDVKLPDIEAISKARLKVRKIQRLQPPTPNTELTD